MKDKPIDVSIIIPCYNSCKTIKRALKSLENQLYKNFEVIIINDGSIDNTEDIIIEYLDTSKMCVKYFLQENQGVSGARNNGLKRASGKFISFLDSDDEYSKEFLKNLIKAIQEDDSDISYCGYTREFGMTSQNNPTDNRLSHIELMTNFMYRKGPSAFCTFLYKKEIIHNNNLNFNVSHKYGEDLEFTWKYLSHCKSGIFVNKKMYLYHNTPNSVINTVNWSMVDAIGAVISVGQYLKKNEDAFYYTFSNYMLYRTTWMLAKDFALKGDKGLFTKLTSNYNVKESMQRMIWIKSNMLIRISSLMYIISPNMFFYFLSLVGRLNFQKKI